MVVAGFRPPKEGEEEEQEDDEQGLSSPKARIEAFLLASLAESSQKKYREALRIFYDELHEQHIEWVHAIEEVKDWILAEFGLNQYGQRGVQTSP